MKLNYRMDSCESNKDSSSPGNKVYLKGAIDGGWQKRGNGRAYNSLSGIYCLIDSILASYKQ